jgi:hypothetical protein
MTQDPKYFDRRSEFWERFFAEAQDYQAYLDGSDPEKARKWIAMAERIPPLSPEQEARLSGHNRKMNVLVYSGVWCGDCVRQGPMLEAIRRACGPEVVLRWIDRDHSAELRDELRICGAMRVPMAVFLSEDFFELGRFGDRTLTTYRAKARRELGAACDAGIVPPPEDELRLELEEWVGFFERMLLMLRLSPLLRERHAD